MSAVAAAAATTTVRRRWSTATRRYPYNYGYPYYGGYGGYYGGYGNPYYSRPIYRPPHNPPSATAPARQRWREPSAAAAAAVVQRRFAVAEHGLDASPAAVEHPAVGAATAARPTPAPSAPRMNGSPWRNMDRGTQRAQLSAEPLAFHPVQVALYGTGDGPRHKVTKTRRAAAKISTSISDRNIWIPLFRPCRMSAPLKTDGPALRGRLFCRVANRREPQRR